MFHSRSPVKVLATEVPRLTPTVTRTLFRDMHDSAHVVCQVLWSYEMHYTLLQAELCSLKIPVLTPSTSEYDCYVEMGPLKK